MVKWKYLIGLILIFTIGIVYSNKELIINSSQLLDQKTKQAISIALVNEDLGETLNQEDYQFGLHFVNKLIKDPNQNWVVMTRPLAENALTSGNVDAIIYIHQDFSKKLLQLNEDQPEQVQLDYSIATQENQEMENRMKDKLESFAKTMNEDVTKVYLSTILFQLDKAKEEFSKQVEDSSTFLEEVKKDFLKPLEEQENQLRLFGNDTSVSNQSIHSPTATIENAINKVDLILNAQIDEKFPSNTSPEILPVPNKSQSVLSRHLEGYKEELIYEKEKVANYFNDLIREQYGNNWISLKLGEITDKLEKLDLNSSSYESQLSQMLELQELTPQEKIEFEEDLKLLADYSDTFQIKTVKSKKEEEFIYKDDFEIDLSQIIDSEEMEKGILIVARDDQNHLNLSFEIVDKILTIHYELLTTNSMVESIQFDLVINHKTIPITHNLPMSSYRLKDFYATIAEVNLIANDLRYFFASKENKQSGIDFNKIAEDSFYNQINTNEMTENAVQNLGHEMLNQLDHMISMIDNEIQNQLHYKREEVNEFESYYQQLIPLLQSNRFSNQQSDRQLSYRQDLIDLHQSLTRLLNQDKLALAQDAPSVKSTEVKQLIEGTDKTVSRVKELLKEGEDETQDRKAFSDEFQTMLQHAKKDGVNNQAYIDFLAQPIKTQSETKDTRKAKKDDGWKWLLAIVPPTSILIYLLIHKIVLKVTR